MWLTGYVYPVKMEYKRSIFRSVFVVESEIITLILSQSYYSNISRQLLNSFKTLTILSIVWSSAPLNVLWMLIYAVNWPRIWLTRMGFIISWIIPIKLSKTKYSPENIIINVLSYIVFIKTNYRLVTCTCFSSVFQRSIHSTILH